jgi:hypothetical protein
MATAFAEFNLLKTEIEGKTSFPSDLKLSQIFIPVTIILIMK